MLFSKNRLRKKNDFERVMRSKTSKSAATSFLKAKVFFSEEENTRIGFVVSKKVSKKAILRNKIKRRLREAARKMIPGLKPGFDVVVFTTPDIVRNDYSQIEKALAALFQKADLWQKK